MRSETSSSVSSCFRATPKWRRGTPGMEPLAVDQRPDAGRGVLVESVEDVVAVVEFARRAWSSGRAAGNRARSIRARGHGRHDPLREDVAFARRGDRRRCASCPHRSRSALGGRRRARCGTGVRRPSRFLARRRRGRLHARGRHGLAGAEPRARGQQRHSRSESFVTAEGRSSCGWIDENEPDLFWKAKRVWVVAAAASGS